MILIAHTDRGLTATATGGTYATGMGLDQLARELISATARTTTTSNLEIDITLTEAGTTNVVAIVNHNLDSNATVRFRAYTTSGRTVTTYDSTALSVTASNANIPYQTYVLDMGQDITSLYWRVNITNAANADTYLEFSRICFMTRLSLSLNADYGIVHGVDDTATNISTSYNGMELIIAGTRTRYATLSLSNITDAEAINVLSMMLHSGIAKNVLYQLDDADYAGGAYTIFGRLQQLSPINTPFYQINQTSFAIKEVI